MSDTHFEIFRQNHATGSWSLVEVLEDRDQALERARGMLHDGRTTAVRVVKETFDPDTGGYISLNLFEDGRINTKKKNTKIDELEELPICNDADDLYTQRSRVVIGRTLSEWLAANRLTVIELIHSASALQKLDSHGQTLQHALQKIAVARAFGSDKPVTQFIRQLNELCSAGIRRVYRDDRSGAFEGGAPGKLRTLIGGLAGLADADYRVSGVLTKYLKPATTWDAKLALLLGLLNELPDEDDSSALLLHAIDAFVSEIVATPAALADLLGPQPDLGHTLLNLVSLFSGTESGERTPSANMLAGYFKRDMLHHARATAAARLLSELRSMKRLCPASWDKEILMLRRLANALVQACGKYLLHDDVIDAFSDRSRRLVTHEPLYQYLQDARSPDEKVARLLTVEENIIGAENKRELATFILPQITMHNFEEQAGNGVLAKLKRVAELQARVLRSGFQETQKNHLAAALDGVAKAIEEKARLLASLETRFTNPVERAQALLKLAGAGALTQGELQMKARKMIMGTLGSAGFFAGYVAKQQQDKERPPHSDLVLQELTTELRAFGITYEEALRVLAIQNVVLI
jgi:hypothetical protein